MKEILLRLQNLRDFLNQSDNVDAIISSIVKCGAVPMLYVAVYGDYQTYYIMVEPSCYTILKCDECVY